MILLAGAVAAACSFRLSHIQSTRNTVRGPVRHPSYLPMRCLQSPDFKRQVMPPIGDDHQIIWPRPLGGLTLYLPNRAPTPHICKVTVTVTARKVCASGVHIEHHFLPQVFTH